ncbi:lipopolysaccharide biosynthesis protein [Bradyrhizobium zhanjiangense]|nr:hypothetical protein [Bradyrhizobium zhanjiangense]
MLARALSFVSVLLFAHAMTPAEFGIYAFLQASTSVIVVFATLNLPTPITVVLARGGGARLKLENTILVGAVLSSILLSALVSASSYSFAFPDVSLNSEELVYFIVLTGMNSLQILTGAALIARGRHVQSALAALMTTSTVCLGLTLMSDVSLVEALRLAAVSATIGGVTSIFMVLSGGLHYDFGGAVDSLRKFLKRSGTSILIFSLLSFCGSLSFQFGLWFLQRQLLVNGGAEQAATFAIGNQFYNIVLFLPGIFGPLLLRRLSRTREEHQLRLALCAGAAAVGVSILGIIVFILMSPLILMLLPSKYQIDAEPLVLSIVAGAIMFAKAPLSVFFQARVSAGAEVLASVVGSVVLVIGAWIPVLVVNATQSLWLRVGAHLALLLIVLVALLMQSRSTTRKFWCRP